VASRAESVTVNACGLVQGIALVTFPAASTIFTARSDYDLSSSQYGVLSGHAQRTGLCHASAASALHAFCMHAVYNGSMGTTVVQVRDVPLDVVVALKARAEARGISLAAFLRELLANEAAMPPIEDVMANIASREPVSYTVEDLRSFIDDERR
jgi:Antitoxin FitA-like, ribbon-helix-helix